MKQHFTFALLLFCAALISCNKQKASVTVDPNTSVFLESIKPFTTTYGSADISSIKTAERNNGKLKITMSPVFGASIIKRYILITDNRIQDKPRQTVYYTESDFPLTASDNDKKHFNGYVHLLNLSINKELNFKVIDGVLSSDQQINAFKLSVPDKHWACVSKCCNDTMNSMSFGTYVLCLAALPDCAASVFLGCELDCTFN